eukprot:TRINITY_DN21800_c0_g1_i1.p1 TRINITY_DN21800_c0_g1~~TRINITY_DN21800_c0_g1_i1.p1  ORF type:complete len:319 (+),score=25.32 TRINITY_DN21800_c0_g1_i1:40-957(+)
MGSPRQVITRKQSNDRSGICDEPARKTSRRNESATVTCSTTTLTGPPPAKQRRVDTSAGIDTEASVLALRAATKKLAVMRQREGFWAGGPRPTRLSSVNSRRSPKANTFPASVDAQTWLRKLRRTEAAVLVHRHKGSAVCHLCSTSLGGAEYEDPVNGFRWPGGLLHYISVHSVGPSAPFLEYINNFDIAHFTTELREIASYRKKQLEKVKEATKRSRQARQHALTRAAVLRGIETATRQAGTLRNTLATARAAFADLRAAAPPLFRGHRGRFLGGRGFGWHRGLGLGLGRPGGRGKRTFAHAFS